MAKMLETKQFTMFSFLNDKLFIQAHSDTNLLTVTEKNGPVRIQLSNNVQAKFC